jgi:hypothetical protein
LKRLSLSTEYDCPATSRGDDGSKFILWGIQNISRQLEVARESQNAGLYERGNSCTSYGIPWRVLLRVTSSSNYGPDACESCDRYLPQRVGIRGQRDGTSTMLDLVSADFEVSRSSVIFGAADRTSRADEMFRGCAAFRERFVTESTPTGRRFAR